MHRFCQK